MKTKKFHILKHSMFNGMKYEWMICLLCGHRLRKLKCCEYKKAISSFVKVEKLVEPRLLKENLLSAALYKMPCILFDQKKELKHDS